MTLQTFVVYFIAASMGMVGFYATVSYVILGLIGLPIFAAGGGFGYVMSPTFGFLYGMILASFVIAYFSKNLFNKDLIRNYAGDCHQTPRPFPTEFDKDLMKRIIEDTKDIGKVETHPKFEGRQMIMIIQPN